MSTKGDWHDVHVDTVPLHVLQVASHYLHESSMSAKGAKQLIQ